MADEIKVQITADASGLESGAKQATDAVDGLNDKLGTIKDAAASGSEGLKEAGESASSFGASLGSVGEIIAGVFGGMELEDFFDKFKEGMSAAIFGTAELGEKLTNMAMSTGISVDNLERLRFDATMTGTSFDVLQRSMSELSLKMLELQSGTKDDAMSSALAALHLTPADLADANTALEHLAGAIRNVGISEATIGDVSELLGGRGGAMLIPILENLDAANQKFDELHLALNPGQVQAAAAAAGSFHVLWAEIERTGNAIGSVVLPRLAQMAEGLTDILVVGRELASSGIDDWLMTFGGDAEAAALKSGHAAQSLKDMFAAPGASVAFHAGGGAPEPTAAAQKAAAAAAKTQEDLQKEFAKTSAAIGLQTADYQRLADAIGLGTNAMRAAQTANDIAGAQSRLGPNATPAMDSQIAQEVTARDQAKFAIDDQKASLVAYDREQQKSNELIQKAIDAADGLTGKYKLAADQLDALGLAVMDGDIPAMLQLQTALAGIGVELTKTSAKAKESAINLSSVFDPVVSALDDSVRGIVQGTQTASEAFRKMGESIGLEAGKSGLDALLAGAKTSSPWSSIFGVSGKGGGIAGMASNALTGGGAAGGAGGGAGTSNASGGILAWLLGPAESSAVMSSIKSITGGTGGLFGWLFGTAGTAIMSAFGGASSAAGSAAPTGNIAGGAPASTAGGAVGNAAESTAMSAAMGAAIKPLQAPLGQMLIHLGALAATSSAQLVESVMHTVYLEMIAAWDELTAMWDAVIALKPSILGTTFAGGGVVPSAAGGMIVGGGIGASLAILHSNEMVLPEPISRTIQNMTRDGTGGGDIHTHFHIAAMDGKSVSDFFDRHGDDIARSIQRGVRNQNPKMHAAIKMGSR